MIIESYWSVIVHKNKGLREKVSNRIVKNNGIWRRGKEISISRIIAKVKIKPELW